MTVSPTTDADLVESSFHTRTRRELYADISELIRSDANDQLLLVEATPPYHMRIHPETGLSRRLRECTMTEPGRTVRSAHECGTPEGALDCLLAKVPTKRRAPQ